MAMLNAMDHPAHHDDQTKAESPLSTPVLHTVPTPTVPASVNDALAARHTYLADVTKTVIDEMLRELMRTDADAELWRRPTRKEGEEEKEAVAEKTGRA